jgi:DNA polymerase-3 subunit alpha
VDNIDPSRFTSKAAESLIYAGAFDCLLDNRASALRIYRLYSEQAKKEKNKVIVGQSTLFDLIAADTKQTEDDLISEDFSKGQRLSHEKDMLGIYVSGHPLDDYRWIVEEISNSTSTQINHPEDYPERKPPTDVIMVGMISSTKIFTTKNENKKIAVILFEYFEGTQEVIIFTNPFENSEDIIRDGEIVVVRGKEEHRGDEVARIIASKITPIDSVEDFLLRKKTGTE